MCLRRKDVKCKNINQNETKVPTETKTAKNIDETGENGYNIAVSFVSMERKELCCASLLCNGRIEELSGKTNDGKRQENRLARRRSYHLIFGAVGSEGFEMKKSSEFEMRQWIGDLNAVCGWKEYRFEDGPASGVRAFDFKNGRNLEMTVLADRAFDLPYVSYKGHNMGFTSKQGVRHPAFYVEDGVRGFLKQFSAGLLTTCGMTYVGTPGVDGRELGLHGPFSNLPVHQVSVREDYEGDDKVFKIEGKVRESCVFEENMLMKRSMTLETERDVIRIHDVLENQSFSKDPVMMIYHINFGYPMLDAGAKVYTSGTKLEPRDPVSASGLDKYSVMEAPTMNREEECFFHTGLGKEAFAMLHNEKLGIAAIIRFDGTVLQLLCEWKCMRAGDYALGLEPTTSGVLNRKTARENGLLTYLDAGETREYDLEIEFTDDPAVIEHYKKLATNP